MSLHYRSVLIAGYLLVIMNMSTVLGIGFANPIEKGILLLAALLYVRNNQVYWPVIFIMVAMICITLFSALFSANPGFSWSTYVRGITQLLVIFLLLAGVPTEADKQFIAKWVAWLPMICVGLGGLYHIAGIKPIYGVEYASGVPRLGGSLIPPFLAGLCIAGSYAAVKYAEKYDPRYLYLVGVNLLILLLTSARMPLLIATVLCFVSFMFGMRGKSGLKTIVVFFGLCAVFLFLAAFGDVLLSRLTQSHMSGREVLWAHLEEVLAYYYDFGVGYGHQILFMPREVTILTGGTIGAHNEYLRIAVEIGYWPAVLFFVLMALGIVALSRSAACQNPKEVLIAGALYLAFCATDNVVSSPELFLFLIVAVMLSMGEQDRLGDDAEEPDTETGNVRSEFGR